MERTRAAVHDGLDRVERTHSTPVAARRAPAGQYRTVGEGSVSLKTHRGLAELRRVSRNTSRCPIEFDLIGGQRPADKYSN